MTKMADFTMEELMLFVIGVLGALGGFFVVLQKSKCESICWGCCKRDVRAVIEEEKLQLGKLPTPRPTDKNTKKDDKLPTKEPEVEK